VWALALVGGAVAVLSLFTKAVAEPTQLLADGTVSKDGATPANPRGLAKAAGLALGPYALARLGTSEAGNLPPEAQLAVMWTAKNRAAALGISVHGLLLHASAAGKGYFGKQSQPGRYASTSQDSTAVSRALAPAVAAGSVADPTGGAEQWDSPRSFSDWTGTSSDKANAVAAARIAAGNVKVILPGIPESQIRFWRPV
jgi:hypothetical protein